MRRRVAALDASTPSPHTPRRSRREAAPVTTTVTPTDLEPIRRRDDLVAPVRRGLQAACVAHRPGDGEVRPLRGDAAAAALRRRARAFSRPRGRSRRTTAGSPEREHDGGPVIALMRGRGSITLEPGAQLELSGAHEPRPSTRSAPSSAATCASSGRSRGAGRSLARARLPPVRARASDFDWVPKQRYGVMREYLPTRGGHALDMMLRTCTVQANLDYASEADAMRKMRVVARARAGSRRRCSPTARGRRGARTAALTYRGARLARRRSGSLGSPAGAVEARSALRRLRRVGARRARCSSSSGTGARSPTPGRRSARFWNDGFEGHAADDGGLEDAPEHALPRGAPQEDHRGARRGRAVDRHGVRAARAVDRHALRRAGARRGRGARSRAGRTTRSPSSHARLAATGCAPTFRGAAGRGRRAVVDDRRGGARAARVVDASAARTNACTWRACESSSARGADPADALLEGIVRAARDDPVVSGAMVERGRRSRDALSR